MSKCGKILNIRHVASCLFYVEYIMNIKNIAIIAHVDHGKTTLVDAMLKQTHTFRENQKEMSETLIMDSNDLEREKGITILSKNTAVYYKDTKINIIDTPGHSDFGGEVERVLNMASGAILLVDAAEGPLPQTKFVLKKALDQKLKIILLINKIDKRDARPIEVLKETENLFLELAEHPENLNFKILYAVGRDGRAFYELPKVYNESTTGDLTPLFETIDKEIENSNTSDDKPFQMMISTLDFDSYVGKICIGKVNQGTLKVNSTISVVDENKSQGNFKVQKLYSFEGLSKKEVTEVVSGDIVAIAGITVLTIGQTVTATDYQVSLPKIQIEEPTIKITLGPNTSPLAGREGKYVNSSKIKERLLREKETNLGLKIEPDPNSSNFVVAGRGELHLAVLIETMRREGYEVQVSKPEVIYKTIDGVLSEPFEEVTIDVDTEYTGAVTEELGKRNAQMIDMKTLKGNMVRFVYKISSQNLIGLRNILLTNTRGTVAINTLFLGYYPKAKAIENLRNGAMIATEAGSSLAFGLANAQERGMLFIGPGEDVYEGMVVGLSSKERDMDINVCKAKKQTNVRSETADIAVGLVPPVRQSLEQALDFINDDEVLEVTPQNVRIRKKHLSATQRRVVGRAENNK